MFSERKLFGFDLFGQALRPTTQRITPLGYKLAEGINPYYPSLSNLPAAKSFIENKAPFGYTIIPFVKTEKEGIIRAGSELQQLNAPRYFLKIGGRRVPIQEFVTTGKSLSDYNEIGLPNKNIFESSSSYRIGRQSVLTPLHLVSSTTFNTKGITIYQPVNFGQGRPLGSFYQSSVLGSFGTTYISNLISPARYNLISSSTLKSNSNFYNPFGSYTSLTKIGGSYNYNYNPFRPNVGGGSTIRPPPTSNIIPLSYPNRSLLGDLGKRKLKNTLSFAAFRPYKYQPSLTAQVFNIRGAKPSQIGFGFNRPIIGKGAKRNTQLGLSLV